LVESVVVEYGDQVRWEKVITKDLKGAERFMALSRDLGRPAPVPSIYINGELKFETTPAGEDLRSLLDEMISPT